MLYQDFINQNYVIRARKASEPHLLADSERQGVNGICVGEYEPVIMDFPMECHAEMPFAKDVCFSSNLENSPYVFETTLTYDNTNLFDFWNGPLTTYKSKVEPFGGFESIENSSLEELLLSF